MRIKLKDFGDMLKTVKRSRPSKPYCPRCGSPEIISASSYYLLGPRSYVCKKCGYNGPLIMELEKEGC